MFNNDLFFTAKTKLLNRTVSYAKLHFKIDKLIVQAEVKQQVHKELPHFNTAHYTGEWTVVSLRSPGGKAGNIIPDIMDNETYSDTELMITCPALQAFILSFQCPVMSVRLLNLKAGAVIKEHRDADLSFEKGEARLHIPLFTNRQVEFYVEGKQVLMQEGECWYINANLPHRVSNFGETDRIHLVIDCKVNDWLKSVFSSAEVTYAKEASQQDELEKIISELLLQNTEVSVKLAGELEKQLTKKSTGDEKKLLEGWLPYKVIYKDDRLLLQWLYVNDQPFIDPFFDDTISKCRNFFQNSTRFKSVCDVCMPGEWAPLIDYVEPTAFIFHVSRCGSTLVSQLLGINEENISLSEVPVFDDILRMPLKYQASETMVNEALAASIKFYGRKRTGHEKRLFIKTDSWHLLFYEQLRALYPSTPFIILYRNPAEVLCSQQRQRGTHAVEGLIEPALFQFDESVLADFSHNNYMSLVLEKYLNVILKIAGEDKNFLLLNYNEGMDTIMQKIAALTGMELSDADKELFAQRSRFHSKNTQEIFAEKYPGKPVISPNINRLENLYKQIEMQRSNT